MIAGRYVLEREVGRGGMGAVWLARDEVLHRPVALKRIGLGPGGASPDLQRAEREARLAASLSHPHVVAVYDLVTDGDVRWLVMEYVEGTSLAELLRRQGPLPAERAATLLAQACEALSAAHLAGVVHRDVKPSNILVTSAGQVKLTDFGIARAQADATLTQTGFVTGSPAYIAPEVAGGRPATAASDVWSLGATLFCALAGRPPYDTGDNVLGTLYRVVHEDPPRLPDAGWLAPVLEGTMAKEPEARWSVQQVHDALVSGPGRPTAAPPVIAPAPPLEGGAARRGLDRRVLAGLAGGVTLLVLGLAVLVGGLGSGEDEPSAGPDASPGGSPTATDTPTPTAEGPTAAGMRSFVRDYLSTVTTDPARAWPLLTPAFQEASGGLAGYRGFWAQVDSAAASGIRADPESLEVSYRVRYRMADGRRLTDDVTLQLVHTDGAYRIAGER